MSEKNRRKRSGKQRRKQHSELKDHRRIGNRLVPPLKQLDNLALSSWMNERLPDMLWAALLWVGCGRNAALETFRRVADFATKFRQADDTSQPMDPSHSGFELLETHHRREVLSVILNSNNAKPALRPMLLFSALPSHEIWADIIGDAPTQEDITTLMRTVAATLDHQSQASTDCRWMRVIYVAAAGKIYLRKDMEELAREIEQYPNYGDMQKVRPTIRSMEMGMPNVRNESSWSSDFWDRCLQNTPCIGLTHPNEPPESTPSIEDVCETFELLRGHALSTITTTKTDARLDSAFGFGLYALAILRDLISGGIEHGILGRVALRSLVEVFITFAYLSKKDEEKLWTAYRVHGAGQTKLAFLHIDNLEDKPDFVREEDLQMLANEDQWQEFVEINLGHWAKLNLRIMSEAVGEKATYDKFYSWTSNYLHGQWGAVRDTVFETCLNPLHRFHRVPRPEARPAASTRRDAARLVNRVLSLVDGLYPGFDHRLPVDETVPDKS
jgi:Family of unknown function (DUF5677)